MPGYEWAVLSFREAPGERVCPSTSWGISTDRPLISGRKQSPVTRSWGRGAGGGYPGLWLKGAGVGAVQTRKSRVVGCGPGVNPSTARLLSAPHLVPLETVQSLGTVRPLPGQASRRPLPRASGHRSAKQPLPGPLLSKALAWLPVSPVYPCLPPDPTGLSGPLSL